MSTIIMIAVVCGGTFGFMIFMKKRLNRQYAHMRAGELAPRLGMQLLAGNPEFNLATMSVQPGTQNATSAKGFLTQMAAAQVGGTLGEFKMHMAGQPYGIDSELVLYCRQDLQPGFAEDVTTTYYDLRITVHARVAVMPFDLRLRKETMHLETQRKPEDPRMPAQAFGHASLDERYVIETPDPNLPRRIAAALGALPPYLVYLHIIGAGNQLSFVMTPLAVNSCALSLEPILHVLASLAAIFEGRPAPAAMAQAVSPALG